MLLKTSLGAVMAASAFALITSAVAADRPVGSTSLRPPAPLDSHTMGSMLRADRDKDGVVSREELEHYDVGLARRFKEVDADKDGRLTLYEFEKLLGPDTTVGRR